MDEVPMSRPRASIWARAAAWFTVVVLGDRPTWRQLRREEGQTLVEYVVVLGSIAVLVIFAVTTLASKLKGIFNNVTSSL
jgi:Flp pilus assembly pilin Flp